MNDHEEMALVLSGIRNRLAILEAAILPQYPVTGLESDVAYWKKLAIEQESRLDCMQGTLTAVNSRLKCAEFSTTSQTGQAAAFEKRLYVLEAEGIAKSRAMVDALTTRSMDAPCTHGPDGANSYTLCAFYKARG